MPQLRIGLAQMNSTVGDIDGNLQAALNWCAQAADSGCHLVVLPEMMLTGYPVEDLALRTSFQRFSVESAERLARELKERGLGDLVVVFGYLDAVQETARLGEPKGKPLNAAAVAFDGEIQAKYFKHHLPNYGVFDEYRYFVPGSESTAIRVAGINIVLSICEDIWQEGGPVAKVANQNAGLLLVLNGSPFEVDKEDVRLELVQKRALQSQTAIAYVNLVGGQDELVFDGDSMVVSAKGELISRAPMFAEGLLVTDLDLPGAELAAQLSDGTSIKVLSEWPVTPYAPTKGIVAPRPDDVELQYQAVVIGLRDYVLKNGFKSVTLGLSGGIDSALVATIAKDALGAGAVHGVLMPSKYSSDHSISDAQDLAQRLGISSELVEIQPLVDAFHQQLQLTGLAAENLQARARGVTLMAISNQFGHLVLTTGNKSELAVGYSTIYGDAVGGYAPIKDVPKTLVWEMARWRNRAAILKGEVEPIPVNSIEKEPSAELRPDQKDSDSLPDYLILDKLLDEYVENDKGRAELIAAGFDSALVDRVIKLVDLAEYKRRQYPPGPKISARAFGRDRRLPVTNKWREPIL